MSVDLALSDKLDRTQRTFNRGLSGGQLAPLGQGGGSVLFENVAAAEMTSVIEVIVNRGMHSGEFLQRLDVSERRHRPFPPSKREMRILGSVVQPACAFPPPGISEPLYCGSIRRQAISHD